jgi:GNAT superfamily N-acetyltransferase
VPGANAWEVRPAQRADASAVNDLLVQLGYQQDGSAATADRIQAWAEEPANAVWVATGDSDLLGIIALQVCPFFERAGSWARITALVVSERARCRGAGSALVAAAEAFAVTHGCLRMEVTTADHRHDARAFYRHCGYLDQAGTSSRFLRDLVSSEGRPDRLRTEP